MKKFLIAILLICTCIIPKFANGFDKSETCYQFVSGSGDRLAKILDKYFGDGHGGYKDENKKKAVKYFFRSLEQSEESSINCLEVVRVCVLGKLNDTKCEDFITELQAAWRKFSVEQQTKKTQTPVSESVTLKEEKKGSVSKENKKTESKEAIADSLRSKMRKHSNSELDDEVDELVDRQRKYCKAAGCSYDETGYCHVEIIDVGKTSVYCNGKTKYFDDSFNEIKPIDSKKLGRCADWDENRVRRAADSMNNQKNKYDRTMDFRKYQKYKADKDCFEKYGYYFDDENLEIKKK